MILDSSAIIALLRGEPDAARFAQAIEAADVCRLSAANFLETGIVIDAARDPIASRQFDDFLNAADVRIEAVTEGQARIARAAYLDFGRASGHPARLNFGDCFAYALAKETGERLLFKGDDFDKTDISPA